MRMCNVMKVVLLWGTEEQDGKLITKLAKVLVGKTHFPTVKYCAWIVTKLLERMVDRRSWRTKARAGRPDLFGA